MKLLTTKQVARLYGVSPVTVREWVRVGRHDPNGERVRLRVAKRAVRREMWFHPESVMEYIQRVTMPGNAMTLQEAAEHAGVAYSTLDVWVSRGLRINGQWVKLPATKYGWEQAISRNDLEWFLTIRRKERERRQAAIDARLDAVIQRRMATMPAGEGRVRNEKRKPVGKQ